MQNRKHPGLELSLDIGTCTVNLQWKGCSAESINTHHHPGPEFEG
jgi:hypothetical protein